MYLLFFMIPIPPQERKTSGAAAAALSKKEGLVARLKGSTARSRAQILDTESDRIQAVVRHPAYKVRYFVCI
jgi:hypothetical protein